jgi:hypothetical protein
MAFLYSTGFRNAVLDTGSVKSVFDGGTIKVYDASSTPENADAALPADAVQLVEYSVSGAGLSLASTAANGSIEKASAESWQGTASSTGVGVFFRFEKPGDTGESSTTDVRIQGTVGGGGADLFLTNNTFTQDSTYSLDFFSLTFLGD